MLEVIPSNEELIKLMGAEKFKVWTKLCELIDGLYDMEGLWGNGGKAWKYEYKYRRGGKTLCALYAKERCFGFMVILGKAEREKFEAAKAGFLPITQQLYDNSKTYHDGKWMMLELTDTSLFEDLRKLLLIKRKPNKV